jgi:hypothetical protein
MSHAKWKRAGRNLTRPPASWSKAVWRLGKGGELTRTPDRAGPSNLLGQAAEADLDRIRSLFDDLERKRDIAEFLELAEDRRRCAHFHRLREQAFLTFGFLSGGLSLYER